ncbi:MAG: hypothetical protein HZC54_21155 [Verrucomicrobia bacterium]|nr:hypothetical protein [Verrucomicrobiota bacterium]
MKAETKQRIVIACTGILLAEVGATAGLSLPQLVDCIRLYGWPPFNPIGDGPQGIGMLIFIVERCATTSVCFLVSPALLTMITFHVVWRTRLAIHALITISLSFFLGLISTLIFAIEHIGWGIFLLLLNHAISLAIVVVVELLMKDKLQAKSI